MIKKLIILLALTSCFKKEYNQKTCQEIAFKAYKGHPRSNHEFDKNCKNIKLLFDPKMCQAALVYLIASNSEKLTAQKYGQESIKCFTKNDLKKFSKD